MTLLNQEIGVVKCDLEAWRRERRRKGNRDSETGEEKEAEKSKGRKKTKMKINTDMQVWRKGGAGAN